MLLLGLTGSIATGKSTVSHLLSKTPYSLPIIDADVLAREVVAPGTSGYRQIVSHFGDSILLPPPPSSSDGGPSSDGLRPIDRAALGRLVFSSSPSAQQNRRILNGIVHPAVRLRMLTLILHAYLAGHWAVVLDVPLLFESGLDIFCGSILVVGISEPDVQLRRLLERDAKAGGTLTQDEARGRVESQGRMEWKAARVEARRERLGEGSAEVVWNDSTKEELERAVAGVLGRWRRASPRWWCWLLWGMPPFALGVALWGLFRGWLVRRSALRKEALEKREL